MKKLLLSLALATLVLPSFVLAANSQADCAANETFYPDIAGSGGVCQRNQGTNPNIPSPSEGCVGAGCTYTPLEPIPGLPQTGRDFAGFLNGMFKLMFTLGGMMAVASLVYGGITYMVSEIVNKKEWAKKQMQAALWGLALLAAAWLILYTINPQLINFNFKPTTVNVSAPAPQTPGSVSPGTVDANGSGTLSDSQKQMLLDYYRSNPSFMCTAFDCATTIYDSYTSNKILVDSAEADRVRAFETRCREGGHTPETLWSLPAGMVPSGTSVIICR